MKADTTEVATPEWLVVDLDDTLVRSDLLGEQLVWVFRRTPLAAMTIFIRLVLGRDRAADKYRLATLADDLPVESLPYREKVLDLIVTANADRKKVLLATATDQRIAERIAAHLGVFDLVLGSTEDRNLKGARKLEAIREHVGSDNFTYVGDALADIPILKAAAAGVLVNPSTRLQAAVHAESTQTITDGHSRVKAMIRLVRPHHWVKNLLVFLPLLASHRLSDFSAVWQSVLAALGFSLAASSIYCINDVLDATTDRAHRTKSRRPVASGAVSQPSALALGVVLVCLAFVSASLVGVQLIVAIYVVLNVAYSATLKRVAVVDIMVLASMYVLRILAGGMAASIPLSGWLLSFSLFFFLGLAIAKRVTEIKAIAVGGATASRGYRTADELILLISGVSISVAACLVLALYVRDLPVVALYPTPEWLWLAIPLVLFWSMRLWVITARGELTDDPLVFALKDGVTWVTAIVFATCIGLASMASSAAFIHMLI